MQGTLFDDKKAHRDDFRNMLIWGDNKLVMASLLRDYKGKIDLIYIDPPFDVGTDFSMQLQIGESNESITKEQSVLETIVYNDIWGKGTDSYLHMMFERLSLMKELLKETGSIYVHCDFRVNFFLRQILDEIFGKDYFRNEIIWGYKLGGRPDDGWARKHDTIFYYVKTNNWTFNAQDVKIPYESTGGYISSGRKIVGDKVYEVNPDGKTPEDWWDIPALNHIAKERVDYATQKPEALLERIIKGSSNESDIVVDLFCGSGTTISVAERLGRRWIGVDLGRYAIHTSRKRLIDLQRKLHNENQPYRSFDVYNLGRYERQWWQKERLHGANTEHRKVVLEFYRAEMLPNPTSPLLHGRRGPALVYVDAIDSIFTRSEAKAVVEAAQTAGAAEVHCLAWEFEMDLRMACDALQQEYGVRVRLFHIPREIMEKNRTTPPPFFEMANLTASAVWNTAGGDEPVISPHPGLSPEGDGANARAATSPTSGEAGNPISPLPSGEAGRGRKAVRIRLDQFLPSLAEVPFKEIEALKERAAQSPFDFIDFWAVDFDFHPGQPFNHHWQAYRTRKDRKLPTITDPFVYGMSGNHTVCVKVVDVFGVDTSITVEVDG